MSPRQAKRPVGRTAEIYLYVLSKITDFYLNNNLTDRDESVSTTAPPHASDGFKSDSASFLPIFFFGCSDLFMGMLLKIQVYDA